MSFVTFLLFQRSLYVVLARRKGPKNNVHRNLFKTKDPKIFQGVPRDLPSSPQGSAMDLLRSSQHPPRPPAAFGLIDLPKCLKSTIFPKFLVNTLTEIYLLDPESKIWWVLKKDRGPNSIEPSPRCAPALIQSSIR